ncbi:hypothetical protein CTRI78_v010360 [Colletotrichum trifolii]|uniref:Uncharacterized protein n=1 Tax=Colletotrichum trifolii TaxID=5466 RepID=A0A4R8QS65_COLTR|nr:hypothetical protein CTRI78_v010360 [Colletotrichum trifolii]
MASSVIESPLPNGGSFPVDAPQPQAETQLAGVETQVAGVETLLSLHLPGNNLSPPAVPPTQMPTVAQPSYTGSPVTPPVPSAAPESTPSLPQPPLENSPPSAQPAMRETAVPVVPVVGNEQGADAEPIRNGSSNPQGPFPPKSPASAITIASSPADTAPTAAAVSTNYDVETMSAILRDAKPDIVRQAIRENYQKCLLGSPYHQAFIINLELHHAESQMMRRIVQDYGHRIMGDGRKELMKWITPPDLDAMADDIILKARGGFLDKVLQARLKNIEARSLVNALARAGRLGYDSSDIVENEHVIPTASNGTNSPHGIPNGTPNGVNGMPSGTSHGMPNGHHSALQSHHFPNSTPSHTGPPPPGFVVNVDPRAIGWQPQAPNKETPTNVPSPGDQNDALNPSNLECTFCLHVFQAVSAWRHHVKKRLCTKPVKYMNRHGDVLLCPHCVQTFNSHTGLSYHMLNKVCGDFGPVAKEDCHNIRPVRGYAPIPTAFAMHTQLPPQPSQPTPYHPNANTFDNSRKRPAPNSTPFHTSSSNSPVPTQATVPPPALSQNPMLTPNRPMVSSQVVGTPQAPLGTPGQKDLAHLTQHQIEALLGELKRAEDDFKSKIDAANKIGGTEDEVQKKLTSLRNSFACKQSTVRKKYGIKLRERRNRAEMEAERARMGYGMVPRQGTEAAKEQTQHADKRARINSAGHSTTTQVSQTPVPVPQIPRPAVKQVAVSDIGGGLSGSNATAAEEDPTMSMSQPVPRRETPIYPPRPSSSYQQGSSRVDVYAPAASQPAVSAAPIVSATTETPLGSPPMASAGGTMTAEELLRQMRHGSNDAPAGDDSSSESDSESDSDSSSDEGSVDA